MHAQLLHSARLGIDLHVVLVATDDNIADIPSRRESAWLRAMGASITQRPTCLKNTATLRGKCCRTAGVCVDVCDPCVMLDEVMLWLTRSWYERVRALWLHGVQFTCLVPA